ncbi:PH domain-containing protein [uncultured Cellulomonas sp.]|uniref:PH domain-containing protein n=1 Tax=uncultured Cellulomonas sp. TaxID=189682 RepID=UPI00260E2D26|nr:PH domain-containing protein [uncultured Cellulomonas sp.]
MTTPDGTPERPRPDRARLYAPFRPRMARVVSATLAALVVVGTVALVLTLPDWFGLASSIGLLALGLAIAWFCWRQASVRADVDERGVVVRNLVITRRLEWAQVVSVRFGGGRPWVQLDLSDGDVLAVMAVQQADGAFAEAEAGRLAALVAIHTRTAQDD